MESRDEGCPLLLEAARRYREMGMPEAEEARGGQVLRLRRHGGDQRRGTE